MCKLFLYFLYYDLKKAWEMLIFLTKPMCLYIVQDLDERYPCIKAERQTWKLFWHKMNNGVKTKRQKWKLFWITSMIKIFNNKKQALYLPATEAFVYNLFTCTDRAAHPLFTLLHFFCHNRMISCFCHNLWVFIRFLSLFKNSVKFFNYNTLWNGFYNIFSMAFLVLNLTLVFTHTQEHE